MAKGGIIMDVTTAEEATVAENAGVSLATRHLRVDKVFKCVNLYHWAVLFLCYYRPVL